MMTLEQLVLIGLSRRRVAISVFLTVVTLAAGFTFTAAKQYTATASVVVDAKTDPIAGPGYAMQPSPGYMATQVDIVASERVANRVVRVLKLNEVPEFRSQWEASTGGRGSLVAWLSGNLRRGLSVFPSRESSVINISFQWPDAKAAAQLANAFAAAYIETSVELKVEPARQYAKWFDDRSRELRADLERKQKRLADFQRTNEIVATDERINIETLRLAELSSQALAVQVQRQDSQSRQAQAKGNNETLPEILSNPLIAGFKGDLARAEARREDIVTRLGKNHPDYQTSAAEITSLRERIIEESGRIVASLKGTAEFNALREGDIGSVLEAQKRRVYELRDQLDAATVLQNDVVTAQRILDAVTERLAQSNLEGQTQQTNIVLLTPAVEPLVQSSPRILRNLVLALLLGGMLAAAAAVGMEMRDRRVRSGQELLDLLGVPVIGSVVSSQVKARKQTLSRLLPLSPN